MPVSGGYKDKGTFCGFAMSRHHETPPSSIYGDKGGTKQHDIAAVIRGNPEKDLREAFLGNQDFEVEGTDTLTRGRSQKQMYKQELKREQAVASKLAEEIAIRQARKTRQRSIAGSVSGESAAVSDRNPLPKQPRTADPTPLNSQNLQKHMEFVGVGTQLDRAGWRHWPTGPSGTPTSSDKPRSGPKETTGHIVWSTSVSEANPKPAGSSDLNVELNRLKEKQDAEMIQQRREHEREKALLLEQIESLNLGAKASTETRVREAAEAERLKFGARVLQTVGAYNEAEEIAFDAERAAYRSQSSMEHACHGATARGLFSTLG